MSEAAILSPEAPQRRAVEAEIAREGEWAESEWMELLQLDEHLRIELQRVDAPAGLEEKLLAIPSESAKSAPRLRWAVAAAAAVLLVIAGSALFFLNDREASVNRRIANIGRIIIEDHAAGAGEAPLAIETDDISALFAGMEDYVGFTPRSPELPPEYRLTGGRACVLAGRRVIYTRWIKDGREYSLCMFCPDDFGLPNEFPKQAVAGGADKEYKALVWARNGCAFALVEEGHGTRITSIFDKTEGREVFAANLIE